MQGRESLMKIVCIDNTPHIYKDGSSDRADEYLTVGKIYDGKLGDQQGISPDGEDYKVNMFILESDIGGYPYGHRWWKSKRFKFIEDIREDKLNELGI